MSILALPEPECPADVEILEGLSLAPAPLGIHAALAFWHGEPPRYDWRAAQIASWNVAVASCARCKRTIHWAVWSERVRGRCPYGCD